MSIKAIETRYKGYRFRSRTEARWAVYFDTLGIEFDYELEGYVLGAGDAYLPDFWLPQVSMFAEVKGCAFTIEEHNRCDMLPGPCLRLDGQPAVKPYEGEVTSDDDGVWRNTYALGSEYLESENRFFCATGMDADDISGFDDISRGVKAARSARFEHGETGAK